jgi:signal transduction histidine kinase
MKAMDCWGRGQGGRGVAFRWRIRHKLMFGLGLVVAIITVLLGGALYGLWSYRATMKSIESKLVEQRAAAFFKSQVSSLASFKESAGRQHPVFKLLQEIDKADDALKSYEEKLNDTVTRGRDPDNGFEENNQVEALKTYLSSLRTSANALKDRGIDWGTTGSHSFLEFPEIKKLSDTSDDLLEAINRDVARRISDAKVFTRNTLWFVFSTSIVGIILLCSLLRFFYAWVFYPIRDLEEGAGRVAHGDFEHRIEVHSQDELEDLAAAFNNMTGRLRETYRDLARQVNERSRQLVRSERLASVGFLAAGVAHEINNPLASIAFCSEALEKRLAHLLGSAPSKINSAGSLLPLPPSENVMSGDRDKDREVIGKYLKMIQDEAFRCKAITQRLLEFSRGGERRREPTDLVDLIQAVLDMVQHLPNCKGKKIVFEPAGRLSAWVNSQEIKPVVLNLVVNALDSMDEGGVLTVSLRQRDGMAEMDFTDTGCGMSAETLENIFEPFFTRSRTGKGTGLGLSISHRVISQHGGEIDAFSAGLNQGSTFTVRLPLQPAEPVKEESLAHAA